MQYKYSVVCRRSSEHQVCIILHAHAGWSMAYRCYLSSSFFKLRYFPWHFSNSYEIATFLQNSSREFWFCCVRDFGEDLIKLKLIRVFPKCLEFFLYFSLSRYLFDSKKKARLWPIQSTNISTNCVRVSQGIFVWSLSPNN